MLIRIALCDDEQKILDEVSQYIKKYADKKNNPNTEVFCFNSSRALKSALDDKNSFDIFVLDVYIGDELGTALAKSIRKRGIESPIIFLTTSVEHAPESFETATLRYLIKPLNPVKFYEAMDAALAQAEKAVERLIKLKTENGVERINASLILYSEAHNHYQYIMLNDGRQIKVRMTVTELFSMLNKYDGFVRIGSAYVVNLQCVKNISRTEVLLYNNIGIQIPRGKFTDIKNAFWNFQSEGQEN